MRLAALCLAALLCACASPPPVQPAAHERLAEAYARGRESVQAGDYARAARSYEEARRLARSIEDADAIAAAAIDLSIVYQRLGRDAEARQALSEVLESTRDPFPERRLAQAELRRAILALAEGEPAAAEQWSMRAQASCANVSCEAASAILDVRAQCALALGRAQQGADLAQSAAAAARATDDPVATANALRTLGRAQLSLGDAAAASASLEQALEADHAAAEPRKILADLSELARAQAALGNRDASRSYFERALAVGRALGDERSVAALQAQMASSGSFEAVRDRK